MPSRPIGLITAVILLGAGLLLVGALGLTAGPPGLGVQAGPSSTPGSTPSLTSSANSASPTAPSPSYPVGYVPGCPPIAPSIDFWGLGARTVVLRTTKGDIELTIDPTLSPLAAASFLTLASCAYYDGVVFHQVVPGAFVQGGDGPYGRWPDINHDLVGTGGPSYTITDEPIKGAYVRGTVALVHTAGPDSSGSQFLIVLDDHSQNALTAAGAYQIIGHVKKGMELVDAIAAAANGVEFPVDPVVMTTVLALAH